MNTYTCFGMDWKDNHNVSSTLNWSCRGPGLNGDKTDMKSSFIAEEIHKADFV